MNAAIDLTNLDWEDWLANRHGISEEKELQVLKQLPISEENKAKLMKVRIGIFNEKSDSLAEDLFTGKISIGKWEETMKKLIREEHASCAAIAKGGWDEMTWKDWGRLGTPLREQYKYLHGFAKAIEEKKDTISLRAIQARARLYGQAGAGTGAIIQAGKELEGMLPWLPRDGSTECLVNCHCAWVLEVISHDKISNMKVVEAVWQLGIAEHCDTCVKRDGHTEVLVIPEDVVVPSIIGGY